METLTLKVLAAIECKIPLDKLRKTLAKAGIKFNDEAARHAAMQGIAQHIYEIDDGSLFSEVNIECELIK